MNLLLAVVADLGSFALGAVKGFFLISPKIETPGRVLHGQGAYTALPASTLSGGDRTLAQRISYVPAVETPRNLQKSTVMYTSSIVTPLRSAPGALGDTVYSMLPYGTMVMVLEVQDMWAQVASGPYTGWVYVDDLEDRAAHVYPGFHIGEINDAEDPATIRVRALINDEFGAGELGLPLQTEEYVAYRLLRKGVKIAWPQVRPRTPGTWGAILHKTVGVMQEQRPQAGTVMEYFLQDEGETERRGYLAYVEAVFPDDSLQISEVGWPQQGMYNERVLVADEWRNLAPTFLSFS